MQHEFKFTTNMVRVDDLTPRDRDQMFALMRQYFDGVNRHRFEADLAEKQWACILSDHESQRVMGFSTLMRFESVVRQRRVAALFSGDTIIHRNCWGRHHGLLHAVGHHMMNLAEATMDADTYWLLVSSGYKTYRLLPVCFIEFFPRHNAPTPLAIQQIVNVLTKTKFGDQYDQQSGVLKLRHPTPLRPGIADVDERRLKDPHVEFFHRANPGHRAGNELVCIAHLTNLNLTPAGRRLLGPKACERD